MSQADKKNTNSKSTDNGKQQKQRPLILCESFDQKLMSFSPLDTDNERSKAQSIAYPRYKYPKMEKESSLVFVTPPITLTQYGLPQLGEFYKDDKSRGFIKVPIDPSQPACVVTKNMLAQIDEVARNSKEKIFAEFAKLYEYSPIVRAPQEDDGSTVKVEKKTADGKKKEPKPRFEYFKVKLDREFGKEGIRTKFFVKENQNAEPVERKYANETALEKDLRWGSTVRLIIMANKLWAAKTKKSTEKFKTYGITLKAVQVELVPRESAGGTRELFEEYAFNMSNDSKTTTDTKTAAAAPKKEEAPAPKKEDSPAPKKEETPAPKKDEVKKSEKKDKKKQTPPSSDSDSDSDSDGKNKNKNKKKESTSTR